MYFDTTVLSPSKRLVRIAVLGVFLLTTAKGSFSQEAEINATNGGYAYFDADGDGLWGSSDIYIGPHTIGASPNYSVGFMSFNTGSLPNNAEIQSVELHYLVSNVYNADITLEFVHLTTNPSGQSIEDFIAAVENASLSFSQQTSSSGTISDWKEVDLGPSAVNRVSPDSWFYLGLRSTGGGGMIHIHDENFSIPPYLLVTYTQDLQVSGAIQYIDPETNATVPIRWARIEMFDANTNVQIARTTTDAGGFYDVDIQNIEAQSIYARIFADTPAGAAGIGEPAITALQSNIATGSGKVFEDGPPRAIPQDLPTFTYSHTINSSDPSNEAFHIHGSIIEAWKYIRDNFNEGLPFIAVEFPHAQGGGSFFCSLQCSIPKGIYIAQGQGVYRDVYNFATGGVGAVSDHVWQADLRNYPTQNVRTAEEAMNLAFQEAWAYFFAAAVQNDPTHTDYNYSSQPFDIEVAGTSNANNISPDEGQFYEEITLGTLWDLFDSNNGGADNNDNVIGFGFSGSGNPLFTLVTQHSPNKLRDMYTWLYDDFGYSSADPAENNGYARIFRDHEMGWTIVAAPTYPINPSDGATNQQRQLNYDWDNVALAVDYYYTLGTGEQNDEVTGIVYSAETNASETTNTVPDYNTPYFWRITAKDAYGGLVYSPIWDFETGSETLGDNVCPNNICNGNKTIDRDLSIDGDYLVRNGTLTIEPGIELTFSAGATITVEATGSIDVNGEQGNEVIFKNASGSPTGSMVELLGDNNTFHYAIFDGGYNAATVKGQNNYFVNCIFKNASRAGLVALGIGGLLSEVNVSASLFEENQQYGILALLKKGSDYERNICKWLFEWVYFVNPGSSSSKLFMPPCSRPTRVIASIAFLGAINCCRRSTGSVFTPRGAIPSGMRFSPV